jgi:hypothetical protein
MWRDLLPFIVYALGSAFFLAGSVITIGQKLGWW